MGALGNDFLVVKFFLKFDILFFLRDNNDLYISYFVKSSGDSKKVIKMKKLISRAIVWGIAGGVLTYSMPEGKVYNKDYPDYVQTPAPIVQSDYISLLDELSKYLMDSSGIIDVRKKFEAWENVMGLEVIIKGNDLLFLVPTERDLHMAIKYYKNQELK